MFPLPCNGDWFYIEFGHVPHCTTVEKKHVKTNMIFHFDLLEFSNEQIVIFNELC